VNTVSFLPHLQTAFWLADDRDVQKSGQNILYHSIFVRVESNSLYCCPYYRNSVFGIEQPMHISISERGICRVGEFFDLTVLGGQRQLFSNIVRIPVFARDDQSVFKHQDQFQHFSSHDFRISPWPHRSDTCASVGSPASGSAPSLQVTRLAPIASSPLPHCSATHEADATALQPLHSGRSDGRKHVETADAERSGVAAELRAQRVVSQGFGAGQQSQKTLCPVNHACRICK
jgi:hypothetical protein